MNGKFLSLAKFITLLVCRESYEVQTVDFTNMGHHAATDAPWKTP